MMKNRLSILLIGAALAVASGTAAAHGRIGFGISIGVPGPVYVAPAPVYYPAPPVYYAPPAYYPAYYGPSVYFAPRPWGFRGRIHGVHRLDPRRH